MISLDEWIQQSKAPTPKDVSEACEILIQHVLSMGCDSAVINVGSEEGGRAMVTVKIIDCGRDQDTQGSST
jgi:hypothetical protein